LLKTFFKHYCSQLLSENERLNSSYIEKLKEFYKKLGGHHQVKFNELTKAIEDFSRDIEMEH